MQCWEFKKCGREFGGNKVDELGVCPASDSEIQNGINNGINGGRICWSVSGTMCNGKISGSFNEKCNTCFSCEFMKLVREEEGSSVKIFLTNVVV